MPRQQSSYSRFDQAARDKLIADRLAQFDEDMASSDASPGVRAECRRVFQEDLEHSPDLNPGRAQLQGARFGDWEKVYGYYKVKRAEAEAAGGFEYQDMNVERQGW